MNATQEYPMVEVNGLSKPYGQTVANENVTFSIAKGSVHALLGKTGQAKPP